MKEPYLHLSQTKIYRFLIDTPTKVNRTVEMIVFVVEMITHRYLLTNIQIHTDRMRFYTNSFTLKIIVIIK